MTDDVVKRVFRQCPEFLNRIATILSYESYQFDLQKEYRLLGVDRRIFGGSSFWEMIKTAWVCSGHFMIVTERADKLIFNNAAITFNADNNVRIFFDSGDYWKDSVDDVIMTDEQNGYTHLPDRPPYVDVYRFNQLVNGTMPVSSFRTTEQLLQFEELAPRRRFGEFVEPIRFGESESDDDDDSEMRTRNQVQRNDSGRTQPIRGEYIPRVAEHECVECPICQDNRVDRVAIPCGHMACAVCVQSLRSYRNHNCPMCRAFVQDYTPIVIGDITKDGFPDSDDDEGEFSDALTQTSMSRHRYAETVTVGHMSDKKAHDGVMVYRELKGYKGMTKHGPVAICKLPDDTKAYIAIRTGNDVGDLDSLEPNRQGINDTKTSAGLMKTCAKFDQDKVQPIFVDTLDVKPPRNFIVNVERWNPSETQMVDTEDVYLTWKPWFAATIHKNADLRLSIVTRVINALTEVYCGDSVHSARRRLLQDTNAARDLANIISHKSFGFDVRWFKNKHHIANDSRFSDQFIAALFISSWISSYHLMASNTSEYRGTRTVFLNTLMVQEEDILGKPRAVINMTSGKTWAAKMHIVRSRAQEHDEYYEHVTVRKNPGDVLYAGLEVITVVATKSVQEQVKPQSRGMDPELKERIIDELYVRNIGKRSTSMLLFPGNKGYSIQSEIDFRDEMSKRIDEAPGKYIGMDLSNATKYASKFAPRELGPERMEFIIDELYMSRQYPFSGMQYHEKPWNVSYNPKRALKTRKYIRDEVLKTP